MDHLFRLQRGLFQDYGARAAAYQEELAEYKLAKKAAEDNELAPPDVPVKPVLKRLVCSDTTIEKLAEILEDNPRGLLVANDELNRWFCSFCRYKSSGGTDLPHWLEMHRAGDILVDRKTGERRTLYVPRAATSITGGIQPGVLSRVLTTEFLEAGLPARILPAMPPRLPKKWSEIEVDPEVERVYQTVLEKLLALDFDGSEQDNTPYVLRLSKSAKSAWVAFYDSWAEEQASAYGEVASALSKLEGYTARFALLHHVVGHVARGTSDLGQVEPHSIEAGTTLCRWFAKEARRLYAMLAESEGERDRRRLLEFIQCRGGKITVRGLMRANNRRYPTSDAALVTLRELVEAGFAEWADAYRTIQLCMTHDTPDSQEEESEPPSEKKRASA